MSDTPDTLRGPLRIWLTVVSGGRPQLTVEVTGPRFLIGRGESCDLVVDDSKVSREHALIVQGSGPFRVIRDLGSANGTLVNGRPLRARVGFATEEVKEVELTGGEWIQLGDTVIRATPMDPKDLPGPIGAEPTGD